MRESFSVPHREVTLKIRYLAVAALLLAPPTANAQKTPAPDSAAAPKPAPPPFDFSGIVFANYQYRTDNAARSANKFDVERAYLTFRASAGERASVRITTDLYQQTASGSDAFYRGWALRAKYAYLQYNYMTSGDWRALARVGLLQTVIIEQDESFWPRWIANSATERAGFFSSADAGIANSVTLPGRMGEFYATITNGPGYTSRETDRFKDFAARLTLTPWAAEATNPLRPLAFSVWGYKGAIASRFAAGGTGQVGPIGDALQRDRWGVHVGSSSPTLVVGAQYARRMDEGETGSNIPSDPRALVDSTGSVLASYAIVRPVPWLTAARSHPLSLLARWDRVTTNTDTEAAYDFIIGGVIWDLNARTSLSLDYQEATPVRGAPEAPTKTWFVHLVARF